MKEFKKTNQIFIKSNNTTNKIFNRYLYCLIPFILLILIYNIIQGNPSVVINTIKFISISLLVNAITQYIFNKTKKEPISYKYLIEDDILTISIILGMFSINKNILIVILSSILTIIIKNILKKTSISSTLYGILFIILSNYFLNHLNTPLDNLSKLTYINTFDNIVKPYGSIIDYIMGISPYYISPLLSLISFIYLFYKKSIKYNIVFSYIATISFIMLFIGILNNMNIWYLFFQLTTGNLIFLSIFCLTDYPSTPITTEGQLIYGITLGITTSILRFIIPELSIVIPLILGPLLLTKTINRISYKLKYNKKYYYTIMTINIIAIITTTIIINILI